MSSIPDIRTPEREIWRYLTGSNKMPPERFIIILLIVVFISVLLLSFVLWAI